LAKGYLAAYNINGFNKIEYTNPFENKKPFVEKG
jgi:hypothetical protein